MITRKLAARKLVAWNLGERLNSALSVRGKGKNDPTHNGKKARQSFVAQLGSSE